MGTWRGTSVAAASVLVMLSAVSCAARGEGASVPADDNTPVGRSSPARTSQAVFGRARQGEGAARPVKVTVRLDGALGRVVTDAEGNTLYRYEGDSDDPPRSLCEDACAATWPPVPGEGAEAGPGIEPGLLGTVTRADGSTQLTLAGRPLYRYAEDDEPGSTSGHGLRGAWFAAGPDGAVAAKRPPALAAAESPELGSIVQDFEGRTLYRQGTDRRGESSCAVDCPESWQPAFPVILDEVTGVEPGRLGVLTLSGGRRQLTLDGWALYRYAGDRAPGDITGHGIDGRWFAVTPQGDTAVARELRTR
ncbi:hypothetical protein [Streptomyces sp. GC420]|uniref:hypothetical protein n=1 Tax=Streptomyces sp. GC420 TaxID=2697568 RepID=UPI001415054C|nr:hypothetical protein [Streptomyces sp. GC420]NBM18374.1 hypothetical protein [Streptomyces sp. GC420]